ncbi:MAG TPA: hypothetical protein VK203_10905 [Nostocaceae cyanobacterium]|nr:hypothetical protein [Nostocaceae cyanobacterium]
MARVLQLNNAANWEQVYNNSFTAVKLTDDRYAPIPEVVLPVLFETHVIAAYIDTDVPEGREWDYAGKLYQRYQLGLTIGGVPEADNIAVRAMQLNRIKLVVFPKLTPNYAVAFKFPKWFRTASLTVWQYTGPDYDSVESSLERIENLLNQDSS